MTERKWQNQKIIDRLMLDHAFLKIRESAKSDKANLGTYVAEIRTKFRLSPYWDGVISWLLTYDGLAKKLPLTGGMIDSKKDPVTGKNYYSIPVYPETTEANIASSAKLIRKRYRDRSETVDVRKTVQTNDQIEFKALKLHESGKDYERIRQIFNDDFDEVFIVSDIPTLIHKANKKSLRKDSSS